MAKYSIKDGMGIIPARTKIITRNAFRLTRIVIPETVKEIQPGAFNGCPDIESIVVSEDNPVYDSREDCNAIVETASNKLIVGCENTLIPDSVTKIEDNAFVDCKGLTSIVIPDSVTEIGESAFAGCTGLTSIIIPDSVTEIGEFAFYGCTGLTNIVVSENNPVYDSREDCNAIVETASNKMIVGCANTIIPNSVTEIGNHAFESRTGLTSIGIVV